MKKTFDCVEMKRKGQESLLKRLEGMTVEQQNAFWAERTRLLRDEAERAATRQKKSA